MVYLLCPSPYWRNLFKLVQKYSYWNIFLSWQDLYFPSTQPCLIQLYCYAVSWCRKQPDKRICVITHNNESQAFEYEVNKFSRRIVINRITTITQKFHFPFNKTNLCIVELPPPSNIGRFIFMKILTLLNYYISAE